MEDNNIIEFDLRGFFDRDSRMGISKSSIMKTIKIRLNNYTLVVYGYLHGMQLPVASREVHTCRSAFNSDWGFNTYEESISDLELKFVVEHYSIEDPEGNETTNVDPESLRMINQILQSIS